MANNVTDDTTQTQPDGSTVRTINYADGSRSVQYTPAPGTPAGNLQALQAQAQAALTTNRAYVNLDSPTAAQTVAEVKALARAQNAMIRLLIGQFDDTT